MPLRSPLILAACCLLLRGDALPELDAAFREAYAAARKAEVERQGAVVAVSGDRLLLLRDRAQVAEALIRPPAFHQLKAASHVPLSIRLLLRARTGTVLEPALLDRLTGLRDGVAAAQGEALPAEGLRLLRASRAFLDEVLAGKGVSAARLGAFGASVRGPLEAATARAARLELEALDGAMAEWRRTHLAGEWGTFRVVVIGSHMARDREVSWQFFSRLLGQAREGGRMVFAEEKWALPDALALLASHRLDGDLGRAFFGDPSRLHRDVLGDGAKKWLESRPRGR